MTSAVHDHSRWGADDQIGANAPFRGAGMRIIAGSNVERAEMTMHVGTHIDALGPFSIATS
jgi:kynurenine formamidase